MRAAPIYLTVSSPMVDIITRLCLVIRSVFKDLNGVERFPCRTARVTDESYVCLPHLTRYMNDNVPFLPVKTCTYISEREKQTQASFASHLSAQNHRYRPPC